MFLVKVMSRPDYGSHYWKEKLISGLPTLFSEMALWLFAAS